MYNCDQRVIFGINMYPRKEQSWFFPNLPEHIPVTLAKIHRLTENICLNTIWKITVSICLVVLFSATGARTLIVLYAR